MEIVDILECKQMLRKPSSASSASKLSENFILSDQREGEPHTDAL